MSAASLRAEIEGRTRQKVGPRVAAGFGGFADDAAPAGALVAVTVRRRRLVGCGNSDRSQTSRRQGAGAQLGRRG